MPAGPGPTIVMRSSDGRTSRFRRLSRRGGGDPEPGDPALAGPIVTLQASPSWVVQNVETRVDLTADTTRPLVEPQWQLFAESFGQIRDITHHLAASGFTASFTAFQPRPGEQPFSASEFRVRFSARITDEFGTMSSALAIPVYAAVDERSATGFVTDLAMFVPSAAGNRGYEVVFGFRTETPPEQLPHGLGIPLRRDQEPHANAAMAHVVERAFAEGRRIVIHFELDPAMAEIGRLLGVELR